MDLCETATAFVLTAELPGLARDQIQHRAFATAGSPCRAGAMPASPCEHYHQVERGHGEFSRTFALPPPVDADRIAAEMSATAS